MNKELIEEAMADIASRLSAQRMLLEVLFANKYAEAPDKLGQVLIELIRMTNEAPLSGNAPATPEYEALMRKRIAGQLQSFGAASFQRIDSGKRI